MVARDELIEGTITQRVKGGLSVTIRGGVKAFLPIMEAQGEGHINSTSSLAGLIAGGAHPDPVPYADIVTFTTHSAGGITAKDFTGAADAEAVAR